MLRRVIDSALIRPVGYSADDRTMEIEFTSGKIYRYRKVPPEVHRNLIAAQSPDGWFNEHVRDSFPTSEVGRADPAG